MVQREIFNPQNEICIILPNYCELHSVKKITKLVLFSYQFFVKKNESQILAEQRAKCSKL